MLAPKSKVKGLGEALLDKAVNEVFDKALKKFADPVLNYVQTFVTKICTYLEDFDANVTRLEEGREDLVAISKQLDTLVHNEMTYSHGTEPSVEVERWKTSVERIAKEAGKLILEGKAADGRMCLGGDCCVARFRYGKKVLNCVEGVTALKEESEKIIKDKAFVRDGWADARNEFPNFKNNLRKLEDAHIDLDCLKDDLRSSMSRSEVKAWVRRAAKALEESAELLVQQKAHYEDCKRSGSGLSYENQTEVSNCIARIRAYHVEGKKYENTTAGPSASSPIEIGPSASSPDEISPCAGPSASIPNETIPCIA